MSLRDEFMEDLWERAEELVRQRIAEGGPCENSRHFERMVEERYQELFEARMIDRQSAAIDRARDEARGV